MARQPHYKATFAQLDSYLGLRESAKGWKYAEYNTRIVRLDDDRIAIRLYTTNVLVFHRDGKVIANTGRWNTVTTRHRIAAYSPVLPVPKFEDGDAIAFPSFHKFGSWCAIPGCSCGGKPVEVG